MSPPALAARLGLEPHPEGGWYRRIWTAPGVVAPSGSGGERPTATAIHYVLAADETSAWHRVRSDELWCWQRGATLRLVLGGPGEGPDDRGAATLLGDRVEDGEHPVVLVPGGHWQRAAPVPGTGPDDHGAALVTCVVSPGFDFADFELGPGRA